MQIQKLIFIKSIKNIEILSKAVGKKQWTILTIYILFIKLDLCKVQNMLYTIYWYYIQIYVLMVCLMIRQCTADYLMYLPNDIHVYVGHLKKENVSFLEGVSLVGLHIWCPDVIKSFYAFLLAELRSEQIDSISYQAYNVCSTEKLLD